MTDATDERSEPAPSVRAERAAAMARRPEMVVGALFALVSVALAASGRFFDDEGFVTWLGAALLADVPIDALYFQKFHPTLSVLFAPVVPLGVNAFLAVHALLGGLTVAFAGVVGRRWFGPDGWVASLAVALSPLFFVSAVTGQSNASGAFVLALGLVLCVGPRWQRFAAGFVLGAAVWARFEQLPYVAGFVLFDAWHRRDGWTLFGCVAFPALYLGSGAVYHGDPLWPLTYPPVLVVETMPSTIEEVALDAHLLGMQLRRFALASPLIWLPFTFAGVVHGKAHHRAMVALVVGTAGLQTLLPLIGHYFNYDYSPRYTLNHLLFASLAVGGALAARPRRPVGTWVFAALAVVALFVGRSEPAVLLFAPTLALPAVVFLAPPRGRALTIAATLAIGAFAASQSSLGVSLPRADHRFDEVAEFVRDAEAEVAYTNIHLLDGLLDDPGDADVRFLVGYDMAEEFGSLLHPHHRQARNVFASVTYLLYGHAVWPCEFPRVVEPGSLLVLRDDPRVAEVYAIDVWTEVATEIAEFPDARTRVYRMNDVFELPARPIPEWMAPTTFCQPCPSTCPPHE